MNDGPMRILLVNDDGIDSERLFYAYRTLKEYGEVMMVTPSTRQSGKSMSISLREVEYHSFNPEYHTVIGTPADCVTVALFSRAFRYKPDLIVSGINKGYNLGIDTNYSGTVGAALQGLYYGYKSIAFSGDPKGMVNIKAYFKETLNYILDNDLASLDYVLNVNFPSDDLRTSTTRIAKTKRYIFKSKILTRTVNSSISIKREIIEENYPEGTDMYAHERGDISISRIWL